MQTGSLTRVSACRSHAPQTSFVYSPVEVLRDGLRKPSAWLGRSAELSSVTALTGGLVAGAVLAWSTWRRKCRRSPQETVLIFGVGFSGERIARQLLRKGWRVLGTSRTAETRQRLQSEMPQLDMYAAASEAFSAAASRRTPITHLVLTAAPGEGGDPLLADLGANAPQLLQGISWVGYLSTVGVYGDCNGAQVDESVEVKPKSKRAQLRVQAEQKWAELAGEKLWIFRLPGIYGPGRGPLAKARAGEAKRIVAGPGHVFSRIHVDDIAGSVVFAMEAAQSSDCVLKPEGGQPVVLNVVDNLPAPGHEVSGFAYELLGQEPPPCTNLQDAELSAIARSFYEESRYVLNLKLRKELGYELLHPTFREGLPAQLREEERLRRRRSLRALPSTIAAAMRTSLASLFSAKQRAPTIVLVDNGSLKAESTLGLRAVARSLDELLRAAGKNATRSAPGAVIASSARFSNRVDPGELGGQKAWTLLELLRKLRADRVQEVVLLPVFFGPSGMVTEFIPSQIATLRSEPGPPLPAISLAPTLICSCPFINPGQRSDDRVARILQERILQAVAAQGLGPHPAVAIVDHGSPNAEVARCRDTVVARLESIYSSSASELSVKPRVITGCCMERREGPDYDFNGRLLEQLLEDHPEFQEGDIVVALMFLQPGRHAGAGGDIAQILKTASEGREGKPQRRIVMTDVIGNHQLLVEILAERYSQAFRPAGW